MKVTAANIGKPTSIKWNGRQEVTGIFKNPVRKSIFLEPEAVANDTIADRKVHGGIHKACYLFSADQYPYWKELYPYLKWDWGMFGENLTVAGLDESEIRIGNIYKIGTAIVQVSQPREPCYKLGIRFGTQEILRQFIDHGHPGTYVRLLEKGEVAAGDTLELLEQSENPLTVTQFYRLLYAKKKDAQLVRLAIGNTSLPEYKRKRLEKFL
jgi:MOSC domain-containing protein YiiM